MKNWQRGIPLEEIEEIQKCFEHYNTFSFSPFTEYHGPKVAQALDEGRMDHAGGDCYLDLKHVTTASKIVMFYDVVIGHKEKGDLVINAVSLPKEGGADIGRAVRYLNGLAAQNIWLYIWEECPLQKAMAGEAGFKKVGVKIRSTAEVYGIYFRGERDHPEVRDAEKVTLSYLRTPGLNAEVEDIALRLAEYDLDFTNHYSNNNKNKTWSALSLRGFFADPGKIEKPQEMNKAWHEKHKGQTFKVQDTELMDKFLEVDNILAILGDGEFERIRFMRLAPGGGELTRHTDQTDPDLGVEDGRLMRVHIPIVTNPDVKFTIWNYAGQKKEAHMEKGKAWYLDIRKPHRALNGGETERIHLVIDCVANRFLRNLIP